MIANKNLRLKKRELNNTSCSKTEWELGGGLFFIRFCYSLVFSPSSLWNTIGKMSSEMRIVLCSVIITVGLLSHYLSNFDCWREIFNLSHYHLIFLWKSSFRICLFRYCKIHLIDTLQTFKTHPFRYSRDFCLRNPKEPLFLSRNSMKKCLILVWSRHQKDIFLFSFFLLHSCLKIVLLWTSYGKLIFVLCPCLKLDFLWTA